MPQVTGVRHCPFRPAASGRPACSCSHASHDTIATDNCFRIPLLCARSQWQTGVLMFTCILWTVHLHVASYFNQWTLAHFIGIIGSMGASCLYDA